MSTTATEREETQLPVIIDGHEQQATVRDIFDHLNYVSYRANRTADNREALNAAYVKLGVGSEQDVARWAARFEQEQANAN